MSKAKVIVNKLLETEDIDAPTPGNIEHLTPVVQIGELEDLFKKRLGLQRAYWQYYVHENGRTDLIITGHAPQFRTSGEAYRATLGLLAPYKITPVDFRYDEEEHELTVFLPKHHVQAPPPRSDEFDWSELQ